MGHLDACLTILSLLVFTSSTIVDVFLICKYFEARLWTFGIITLSIALIPKMAVNVISLEWHQGGHRYSLAIVGAAVLQLGVDHRHWLTLQASCKAQRTLERDDVRELHQHQWELSVLRLSEALLKTAPQAVFQIYIMIDTRVWNTLTGVSAALSLLSLAWAVLSYDDVRLRYAEEQGLSWHGVILLTVWRLATIASRIIALFLVGCVEDAWLFGYLAMNLVLALTLVIFMRELDAVPRMPGWKDWTYVAAVCAAFTFSFADLGNEKSRSLVILVYAHAGLQNVEALIEYVKDRRQAGATVDDATAIELVLGSFLLGTLSLCWYCQLYYPNSSPFLFPGRRPRQTGTDRSTNCSRTPTGCRQNSVIWNSSGGGSTTVMR